MSRAQVRYTVRPELAIGYNGRDCIYTARFKELGLSAYGERL